MSDKNHLPDRLKTAPWFHTGSSAHRFEELEPLMKLGALEGGTFYLTNIKGSKAEIVAPEEFSGSNYDQTFLQGVDVKTYKQATSYITAKIRPNSEFNIIRTERLGEYTSGLHVTSSADKVQHRILVLDEPDYFDDNTSPASLGMSGVSGSKAQLDTSVNKTKARIYNKHYRERRDLGQANLFQDGTAYKDTTTVDPKLIVGQEAGYEGHNIEFPPYMIHASDRISSDGTIEAYPIRTAADRSAPEHPHTARGIKSDLNIIDVYRKSDTIKHQSQKLSTRKVIIGRHVRSFTSFICDQANADADGSPDTITFSVGGISCTVTLKASPSSAEVLGTINSSKTVASVHVSPGSSDNEFATNLFTGFNNLRALGVRIAATVATNTVFLRELLDRKRTRGIVVTVTDASTSTTKTITSLTTIGGFTIEFARYSDYVYESTKTKALGGYDYYLDGVESFGIEVLNNAESVKLQVATTQMTTSDDPEDLVELDAYTPWLAVQRSGTFGESHIGPINTQGYVAPQHAHISPFEDNSDKDLAGVKLTDANTFAAYPNFFLTDKRVTLTGKKYEGHNSLLFQSVWKSSSNSFVTSSHATYGTPLASEFSGSQGLASGSVLFKKVSPYFPESDHYAMKGASAIYSNTFPSVCTISGSHHLSGRSHDGTSAGGFKDDSPWTVSYWMSGSDARATHLASTRDIIHFKNDPYDTADLYPNVENFKVRHFVYRDHGYLYVSLYDNDFYPSNHHRVDFKFGAVRSGVTRTGMRNTPQQASLYNTLKVGDGWNHIAVAYDGGMHSTQTHATNYDYKVSGGSTYQNLLQSLENEDRAATDTITKGDVISISTSNSLSGGTKYVVTSLGNTTVAQWHLLGFGTLKGDGSFTPGKKYVIKTPASTNFTSVGAADSNVGTVFTATNAGGSGGGVAVEFVDSETVSVGELFEPHASTTSGTGTGKVKLQSTKYFETPSVSSTSRQVLYDYGKSMYQPHSITGSSDTTVACPIRLYLNGVDITDSSLEQITHTAVRTTGHNTRYGSDYTTGAGVASSASIAYTGMPAAGNTVQLISASGLTKKYEFRTLTDQTTINFPLSNVGVPNTIISVSDDDTLTFSENKELTSIVFDGGGAQGHVIMSSDAELLDFGSGTGADRRDVNFSIAFWINLTALPGVGTKDYVFGKYHTGTPWMGYDCGIDTDGNIHVRFFQDSTTINEFDTPEVSGSKFFEGEAGNWVHVCMVYTADPSDDGSHTEQIQFYKNGVAWGSAVVSPNDSYVAMSNTLGQFIIGKPYPTSSTSYSLNAKLSSFLVFRHDGQSSRSSTVLTANHVKGLWNGGYVFDYLLHPKQGDLVAYWKLDEDVDNPASGRITDYSGENHHITQIGTALPQEDSTSGLYKKQDTDVTFAFWVKHTSQSILNTGLRTIFAKYTNSGNQEYNVFSYARSIYFRLYDTTPTDGDADVATVQFAAADLLADSTDWQHVAIRYDASERLAYFYLNGVAYGSNPRSISGSPPSLANDFSEMSNSTDGLSIGNWGANTAYEFGGSISNLLIFSHDGRLKTGGGNRSTTLMSEAEVYKLYDAAGTSGSPSSTAGAVYDYTTHAKAADLVGYWKLNETVGNNVVVNDLSSENNNGVMTGATTLTNSTPSGLLATPYSALSNGSHTPVLAGFSADSAYSALASAIALSSASGGHDDEITTVHKSGDNTLTLTQDTIGPTGDTTITATVANATIPSAFTGGVLPNLDFRDIQFTGPDRTLTTAETAKDSGAVAFAGHNILKSKIVVGGHPNATSPITRIVKKTSTNNFSSSTTTSRTTAVHAHQNSNYISEVAMWNTKLSDENISAVWELSKFNDVLFTVEKPMAEAVTRMGASFEEGVDKDHVHETKGFVFASTEHGTDSLAFGGLKK